MTDLRVTLARYMYGIFIFVYKYSMVALEYASVVTVCVFVYEHFGIHAE